MSLLHRPDAQVLLEDATASAQDVRGCAGRLTQFLARYLPLFGRAEQRDNARLAIEGRLGGLERKTCEPIAREADVPRRALQRFVGAGQWDDEAVTSETRAEVTEELGDARGVLALDPSSFPKKGTESCGVKRQWCGRLGKTDNCQVGVFLGYASAKGHVLVDRQLYLPEDWSEDKARREKTYVPETATYQPKWRIGLNLIRRSKAIPHAWITGDDEFGRVTEFRKALRADREHYVLDVPCNTLVRDLDERVRRRGRKGRWKPPFRRVAEWAKRQRDAGWQEIEVRAGEKGPLKVKVLRARVQTRSVGRLGAEETLVVIRTQEETPQTWYTLSDAAAAVPTTEIVRAHAERHRIEETFQEAKGEVGLADYEVRSWTGWRHHMTLCMLALLFVVLEQLRMGKKNSGRDGVAGARDHRGPAASSASDVPRDRAKSQRSVAA
jgi:SRSO17 transposase